MFAFHASTSCYYYKIREALLNCANHGHLEPPQELT